MTFNKSLARVVHNENGSLILGAAVIAAVVGVVMVSVFGSGLTALRQTTAQVEESDFHTLNQKGLSFASYLISNNVVLCRHNGWRSNKQRRCVWGGLYHKPKLGKDQFNILRDGYEKNRYYIEISLTSKTTTQIFFDLADWEEDDNWSSLVGSVDEESLPADDDKDMVLLTVLTTGESAKGTKLQLQKVGGIRRPIGTPEIIVNKDINSGQCLSFCLTESSENPYPECRGLGEFDKDSFQRLNIRVTNLGPGSIYRLGYQKNVLHDDDYFTPAEKRELDTIERFEVMGHDGVGVFMPGEVIEVTDSLSCAKPQVNSNTVVRTVTGPAGTAKRVDTSIFYEKYSTYYYYLTADSKIDVREPASVDDNYRLKKDETLSIIEPRKLGALHVPTELRVNKEIRNIVTMITNSVPAPPRSSFGGDGGGDGDGDGDGGGDGDGCN